MITKEKWVCLNLSPDQFHKDYESFVIFIKFINSSCFIRFWEISYDLDKNCVVLYLCFKYATRRSFCLTTYFIKSKAGSFRLSKSKELFFVEKKIPRTICSVPVLIQKELKQHFKIALALYFVLSLPSGTFSIQSFSLLILRQHFLWIKSRLRTSTESINFILIKGYGGVTWVQKIISQKNVYNYNDLFDQHRDVLKSIFDEIFKSDVAAQHEIKWTQACQNYIDKLNTGSLQSKAFREVNFHYIPQIINSTLNQNHNVKGYLFYVINRCFIEFGNQIQPPTVPLAD